MIEYMTGAGAGLVMGALIWILGFLHGSHHRKPQPEPKAICGCGHHNSYHDEKGCHFQAENFHNNGHYECGCVKYVGPEPLPEFIP